MNDEWMYGRNKRGCEGIFPVSYIDIRVPLKVEPDSGTASRSASVSPAVESHRVRALYSFNAETDEDLTIKVCDDSPFHWRVKSPLSDKNARWRAWLSKTSSSGIRVGGSE